MAWSSNGSPVSINGTEVVINDGAADLNFRVESDDGTNIIFCDAGLGGGAGGLGFFGTSPIVRTNLDAAALSAGSPTPTVAQLDTKLLLVANALAACGLITIS